MIYQWKFLENQLNIGHKRTKSKVSVNLKI